MDLEVLYDNLTEEWYLYDNSASYPLVCVCHGPYAKDKIYLLKEAYEKTFGENADEKTN